MTKGVRVAEQRGLGERVPQGGASGPVRCCGVVRKEEGPLAPLLALVDGLSEGPRYRGLALRSGGEEVLTTWRQDRLLLSRVSTRVQGQDRRQLSTLLEIRFPPFSQFPHPHGQESQAPARSAPSKASSLHPAPQSLPTATHLLWRQSGPIATLLCGCQERD